MSLRNILINKSNSWKNDNIFNKLVKSLNASIKQADCNISDISYNISKHIFGHPGISRIEFTQFSNDNHSYIKSPLTS